MVSVCAANASEEVARVYTTTTRAAESAASSSDMRKAVVWSASVLLPTRRPWATSR